MGKTVGTESLTHAHRHIPWAGSEYPWKKKRKKKKKTKAGCSKTNKSQMLGKQSAVAQDVLHHYSKVLTGVTTEACD